MYYYIGELIFFCMKSEFVWAAKWKQDPGQSCSCSSVWTFGVMGWSRNYMQCDIAVTSRQGARLRSTIERRTIKTKKQRNERGEKTYSNRLALPKPRSARIFPSTPTTSANFDVLLTVHLSIFIWEINQLDAQNLFYNKFISCLYMFRALCAHHQEVKTVSYSIWYHHTL